MATQTLFRNRVLLWFSLPAIVLIAVSSLVGLLAPEVYRGATPNWSSQTTGQDAFDLFVLVPVLFVGTLYGFQGNRFATFMWVGAIVYTVYTFAIYAFAVSFNSLFLVYCAVLGLSAYSLIWFFSGHDHERNTPTRWHRIAGYYLVMIGTLFYLLWLSDVVPALWARQTPTSIQVAGLMTNPVHVLDLSLFLPAILLTGWKALQQEDSAGVLVPSLLMFLTLMETTIAVLTIVMAQAGEGGSFILAAIMLAFAAFSLFLFISTIRSDF